MHYKLIFLFFFTAFLSWSQDPLDDQLQTIYFDSVQIQKKGIHAAHVFGETINKSKLDGHFHVASGKRMEIEFNDLGQLVYQRYTLLKNSKPELGEDKTIYDEYIFDEKNRCTQKRNFNAYEFSENNRYNAKGQIVEKWRMFEENEISRSQFIWENDAIVKVIQLRNGAIDSSFIAIYDKKGRTTETRRENDLRKITYEVKGEMEHIYVTHFENDTLKEQISIIRYTGTDRYTHYCKMNGQKDTLELVDAKYDKMKNLTYFCFKERDNFESIIRDLPINEIEDDENPDFDARLEASKKARVYAPFDITTYIIENVYEGGLLVKRTIDRKWESRGRVQQHVQRTERIVYEKEKVANRCWPGEDSPKKDKKEVNPTTMERITIDENEEPPAPAMPIRRPKPDKD